MLSQGSQANSKSDLGHMCLHIMVKWLVIVVWYGGKIQERAENLTPCALMRVEVDVATYLALRTARSL